MSTKVSTHDNSNDRTNCIAKEASPNESEIHPAHKSEICSLGISPCGAGDRNGGRIDGQTCVHQDEQAVQCQRPHKLYLKYGKTGKLICGL